MSIIKKNTEKYVPTIIQFEDHMYVGFVTEKEANSNKTPDMYLKFMGTKSIHSISEIEKPVPGDFVYKMSLELYFRLSCEFKENGKKYNINRFKYELNDR